MERKLTCIICPRGCELTAAIGENGVAVTGHTCSKGETYAVNECTNPVRTVTATVRVANRTDIMASVKTDRPVPKDRMMDVMARLRRTQINAPAAIGDVVLRDVFGANVVITKAIN